MTIVGNIFAISGRLPVNLMALKPPEGRGVSASGDIYIPPVVSHPRANGDPVRAGDSHFRGNDKEMFVPDRYNDPRHTFDALERLELYRQLKEAYPHLVTPFTARLIRAAELMEYFTHLDPKKFRFDKVKERNEIRTMFRELKRLTREIVEMYTRKEILPDFAISKMVASAYKGLDAAVVLLDFDFTSVNHFDDTDSLGDELVLAIGDSLWDVLRNEEAVKFLGEEAVRVRYPQRSAFLVVANNKSVAEFLKRRYSGLEKKIYERLKNAQKDGRIAQEVRLEDFRLSAVSHSSEVKLSRFKDDLKAGKTSESAVVEHIFSELKRFSGETAFIKARNMGRAAAAVERIAATLVQGGFSVFGQEALCGIGDLGRASLRAFVENGRGFIPLGTFGPGLLENDPDIKEGLTWRDYKHTAGDITRDEGYKGGGMLEEVRADVRRFLMFPTQATINEPFRRFKEKVSGLVRMLLHIGEETRRNDRAPHFMNADKVWGDVHPETNDFVVEQLGLVQADLSKREGREVKLDLFFAVEVDDGRAYTMRYPVKDHVDGNFQTIGWKVFTTYSESGGHPIVGGALGDQMWFGASLEKTDGMHFIPEDILRAIQNAIKSYFIDRGEIFQVYAKVASPDGNVERVQVWILQGEAIASVIYPAGSKMAKKPVTVTVCWTQMPDLDALDAAAQINRKRHLMLSYIEKLKRQNGWRKEGLGRLPEDYVNGDRVSKIAEITLPSETLRGGIISERGWKGADGGAYLSGETVARPAIDAETLRKMERAREALDRAGRAIERARKK